MIIALLTDFGTKDYFVGAMKGVILSINPDVPIIDITHEIESQNIQSAGFTLFSVYKNFPANTIFVAVVDPGVGSNRRSILVKTEQYYFIAPDNGLLSLLLNEENNFRVFELTNENFFHHPVSQTFHGRDIFAPIAAWLSKAINPNEFGSEVRDVVKFEILQTRKISENEIYAEIIHIDHFGNLVTNLKRQNLTENFSLQVNEKKIENHHKYYAEANRSEIFTIIGSAEFLEIVAFRDSAKKILKVEIGQQILLKIQ